LNLTAKQYRDEVTMNESYWGVVEQTVKLVMAEINAFKLHRVLDVEEQREGEGVGNPLLLVCCGFKF